MADDVLLNKAQIIERCLQRVREEYTGHESEITQNYTKQDSIILNLQRACEASLDMAQRVLRIKNLGLPQNYRESFILLEKAGIIGAELSLRMQKMVGFRNIAVHAYQDLEIPILQNILTSHLQDFQDLVTVLLKL